MDKYCRHRKIIYNSGRSYYYFFTWSIPEVSMTTKLEVTSYLFEMPNETKYFASLSGSEDKITFTISSTNERLKCFVSMIIGSKTILLSNSTDAPVRSDAGWYKHNLITLSSEDEVFKKLRQNPNSTLAFICKMINRPNVSVKSIATNGTSTDGLYNLRPLAAVLGNSSESSLKEKVVLKVDEETQTVSKAVLCGLSPVFAKMFENDMREVNNNVVTITDIKMNVLKILISFLYTGKLPDCDVDMICELYYAADKYDVAELRQICVDLIIPQISMENMHCVMKLAFAHDDELLKSTVTALIATNIETWLSSDDWKNLIDDEPKIAAEVLNFFDF
ncbi:unnamed protein product [Larinioides sclopetarius]|uniref:BTB domain-containing protein n=1 Tax=Larinioides sclopetarius TaxID=280406 RepID=A0AAV2BUG8_9ARAC